MEPGLWAMIIFFIVFLIFGVLVEEANKKD